MLVQAFAWDLSNTAGDVCSVRRHLRFRAGRSLPGSEELFLLRHRGLDTRLHRLNSTPKLSDIISARHRGVQVIVGDGDRGHDRDALEPDYFALVAHLDHALVDVGDSLEQLAFLVVGTGDAEFAS